jgi:methylmalonyl-CoA mutase
MEEAYLHKVADPAAGSYYLESLTHFIAHHAWELFKKTESLGGMIECCKTGFIQEEIGRSRQQKIADVSSRKQVILGTNQYPNLQETASGMVNSAPATSENTVYPTLTLYRTSEPFEALRYQTEQYVAAGNKRPGVFLFTMGNLAMLRARAGFTTNFFGCAGYEIIDNAGFQRVEEGVEAARQSGARMVVICGSDEDYIEIVPAIARAIKALPNAPFVVVAGYPKEHIEAFKQAGVDDFIHVRSNLLETLRAYQSRLGIDTINLQS